MLTGPMLELFSLEESLIRKEDISWVPGLQWRWRKTEFGFSDLPDYPLFAVNIECTTPDWKRYVEMAIEWEKEGIGRKEVPKSGRDFVHAYYRGVEKALLGLRKASEIPIKGIVTLDGFNKTDWDSLSPFRRLESRAIKTFTVDLTNIRNRRFLTDREENIFYFEYEGEEYSMTKKDMGPAIPMYERMKTPDYKIRHAETPQDEIHSLI